MQFLYQYDTSISIYADIITYRFLILIFSNIFVLSKLYLGHAKKKRVLDLQLQNNFELLYPLYSYKWQFIFKYMGHKI